MLAPIRAPLPHLIRKYYSDYRGNCTRYADDQGYYIACAETAVMKRRRSDSRL